MRLQRALQHISNLIKMLIKTYDYFLVGQSLSRTKSQLNTMKIDFSKMSFSEPHFKKFIQCNACRGILTQLDKNNDYIINKEEQSQNGKDIKIWMCRFCNNRNIIQGDLFFAPLKYKYVIQKNLTTKITPPILLFLIDHSGSMGQSIMFCGKTGPLRKNKHLVQVKTNSKIYKIIKDCKLYNRQKSRLKKLREQWGSQLQEKQQEQTISKLELLYGIIQNSIKQLKSKPNSSHYRVGFLFFNKYIYLMKAAKQRSIPMLVNNNDKVNQDWPLEKQQINFYCFKELYNKGKQFDRYFGDCKVSNLDTSKINIQCLQTEGQTAFGPALALALGIVSEHDAGSKIIAVTDSQPNYGVLSLQNNQNEYKMISDQLKTNEAMLNIVRWKDIQDHQYFTEKKSKEYEYEVRFRAFCQQNAEFVKIRQVNLQKLVQLDKIEKSIEFIQNLINTSAIGNSLEVTILNDNKRISFQKLQYDKYDYKTIRFINSSSKNWVKAKINNKKIQQMDLVFPSVTQLVTVYDDIFKKQRCLFMSCVTHKMQRQKQISQDLQHLDGVNTNNIQDIFDLKNIQNYKQTYRGSKTFKQQYNFTSLKISQVSIDLAMCSSLNDLANLQNRLQNDSSEVQSL